MQKPVWTFWRNLWPLPDLNPEFSSLWPGCNTACKMTIADCLLKHCPTEHTGCPRRNVKYFGRVFLMLNYTDITQNTYIQSWTVTEIMAREV